MSLTKEAIRCVIVGDPFSESVSFGAAISAAAELEKRGVLDDLRQQVVKLKREAILLVQANPRFADNYKTDYERELDKLVEEAVGDGG